MELCVLFAFTKFFLYLYENIVPGNRIHFLLNAPLLLLKIPDLMVDADLATHHDRLWNELSIHRDSPMPVLAPEHDGTQPPSILDTRYRLQPIPRIESTIVGRLFHNDRRRFLGDASFCNG